MNNYRSSISPIINIVSGLVSRTQIRFTDTRFAHRLIAMKPDLPIATTPKKTGAWLYFLFVVALSFFTYVYHYNSPANPFWDEPYHIASAQKYLNGVFFMEQHPPLGKLFIALGEKITKSNAKTDEFINTDYARNITAPFSFTGYRLFPTLFGWLTAPILFLVFLFLTRSGPLSALFSFLYIFDNAQIVHSRGAMVDSTLTFFGMLMILLFLYIQRKDREDIYKFCLLSFFFGIVFGLVMTTKVVGLVLILLFPAALWRLFPRWRKIFLFLLASTVGFVIAYVAVWQIHFALGSRIVPELSKDGYYEASDQTKLVLANHANGSLQAFPILLKDALRFVMHYNGGVPRLDLCKADENGSPFFYWPFGARTVDYRWEQANTNEYRYLYLVPNPVGWGLGLLAVFLSMVLLLAPLFFQTKKRLQDPFFLVLFLGLYLSYMIAISRIPRVMYLYHYFLPLLFSYILFAAVIMNLQRIGSFVLNEQRRVLLMTFLGFLVFAAFQFYRPFTYYEPISNDALNRRALLPLWELSCAGCTRVSPVVVPRS
jgi:dolichyl-phosphate-mannose--protein O-mannosyl transferase